MRPAKPLELPAQTEAAVEIEAPHDTLISSDEAPWTHAAESRERLVAAERVPEPIALEPESVEAAVSEPEIVAEEEVEEAPASSRRPVAPEPEQQLAQMAFEPGEPPPPRHTPPPESGRLPAAPVVDDFDADVTGVREAAKPARLAPEATRAAVAASDAVAEVAGAPRPFAPQTFVELLDASLAL